ncbi:hypothetical protein MBLNU459_g6850t1 [Dothideomycetes sp. NU459]
MAGSLPLELQQHILQYLDPRSFYAARNVSRWWKHASRDAVTLASQLQQLPVLPPVTAKNSKPESLQKLYNAAARSLMLGVRVSCCESDEQALSRKIKETKVAVSKDGLRAVSLSQRNISLHDLTSPDCAVIFQRPLNDLRTAIGGGPWFKCAPTSVHELALSADGSLLAIALERTIQIYDLNNGPDSWPVSSYISSAAGHYIGGIQFEHNDSLLRVQLSNKGTVLYLGTPTEQKPTLQHWKSKGGLKHAFLDTSRAIVRPLQQNGVAEKLAGLQLLRRHGNGWLFAALKHCTTTSVASYCVGYVACGYMDGHVLTAERNAIILAELPSSLSNISSTEAAAGLWKDLPSAHVRHPHFSLSADGGVLGMSEDVGVSTASNRVFVYRLPSAQKLAAALECRQYLEGKEASIDAEQERVHPKTPDQQAEYEVQPLPISLGSLAGKMLDFGFELVDTNDTTHDTYCLHALTDLGSKTWTLLDS